VCPSWPLTVATISIISARTSSGICLLPRLYSASYRFVLTGLILPTEANPTSATRASDRLPAERPLLQQTQCFFRHRLVGFPLFRLLQIPATIPARTVASPSTRASGVSFASVS